MVAQQWADTSGERDAKMAAELFRMVVEHLQ